MPPVLCSPTPRSRLRAGAGIVVVAAALASALTLAPAGASPVGSDPVAPRIEGRSDTVTADLDADGHVDRLIARRGAAVSGADAAGMVRFVPGGSFGLRPEAATVLRLPDAAAGDRFGAAIAIGDLDGDGRTDLAVGAPGRRWAGNDDAGVVAVFLGRPGGFSASPDVVIEQPQVGDDGPRAGDRFGSALAAGDFDGDGRSELAVAAPGENRRHARGAGSVQVIELTRRGRGATVAWTSKRIAAGVLGPGAGLGSALGTTDVDADGIDDLLIATRPVRATPRVRSAGTAAEFVVHGSRRGFARTSVTHVGRRAARAAEPIWLRRLNAYRAQAGLDPVTVSATLTRRARSYARTMASSQTYNHDLAPDSVIYLGEASFVDAVDAWMAGPAHAVALLNPSITRVGFAKAGGDVEVLTWSGDAGPLPSSVSWPGDGATIPLTRPLAGEVPDPRSGRCAGHDGLPVVARFPQAPAPVAVRSAVLTRNGVAVDHCIHDAASEIGEFVGAWRMVTLLPREPLVDAAEYCYRLDTDAGSVAGCFTVDVTAQPAGRPT